MVEIIWSAKSLKDLQEIVAFIAKNSPMTAEIFRKRIIKATKRLEIFPLSGRIVPGKDDPSLREIIYGNYRIAYDYSATSVEILTVHNASRRFFLS